MAHKYCTFWYPTIYHKELECFYLEGHRLSRVISDRGITYTLHIVRDASENLIVTSEFDSKSASTPFTVVLEKTSNRRNGFVQYRFDTDPIPVGLYDKFKTVLRRDVYHLAKDFYHEHEANRGEKTRDAALWAVVTDTPLPLNAIDNQFLTSYLTDYCEIFKDYAEDISHLNYLAQNSEEKIKLFENYLKQHPKLSSKNKKIIQTAINNQWDKYIPDLCLEVNKLCENALIEYTYCKTLLCSKYNGSFHPTVPSPLTSFKTECRQGILNIRNSIRYIENIKFRNQNRVSQQIQRQIGLTRQALDQGEKAGKISILLGLGGVLLALIFGGAMFLPEEKSFQNHWVVIWVALLGIVILFLIFSYLHINCKYRLKTRD